MAWRFSMCCAIKRKDCTVTGCLKPILLLPQMIGTTLKEITDKNAEDVFPDADWFRSFQKNAPSVLKGKIFTMSIIARN